MLLENFKQDLKAKNRSSNTLDTIEYTLGQAYKHFNKPLESLSIESLKKYFEELKVKGLSPNTIRLHQLIFTQFYDYCLNETDDEKYIIMIRKLKRITIEKVKSPINPREILLPEEIKKLINVATIERDRCIIASLYESGMRMGEFLSLKTDMVQLDELKQEVTFHIPNIEGCKTGARSVVCLEIFVYVQDWLKCNPSKRFIPMHPSGIRKAVKRLFTQAGINKPCNLHHFRHSSITHAAGLNMSETQLSYRFWGISHSTMLSVYIHLNEQLKSSGYRDAKGMGENSNGKTVINPLASRCVECGRLIQAGSLCKTCTDSKKLTEENVKLWKNIEELQSQNAMLDHVNEQSNSARSDYDNQIDNLKSQMNSMNKFMQKLITSMPPDIVNNLYSEIKEIDTKSYKQPQKDYVIADKNEQERLNRGYIEIRQAEYKKKQCVN